MEFSTTEYKRCTLIKISGQLNGLTAPELEKALNTIVDESGAYKLVLDMTDVTFVSSAGWWVLIETQKKCKRYNRGEVVLAAVDPRIQDSLRLVGMDTYFKIFDNVTSAVGSF